MFHKTFFQCKMVIKTWIYQSFVWNWTRSAFKEISVSNFNLLLSELLTLLSVNYCKSFFIIFLVWRHMITEVIKFLNFFFISLTYCISQIVLQIINHLLFQKLRAFWLYRLFFLQRFLSFLLLNFYKYRIEPVITKLFI